MGFTLASKYPADDPAPLFRFCLQHGLPTAHFHLRANSWSNPLTVPGTGTLILPRDTLDSLDLAGGDTFRTLTISDGGNTLKIAKVLIVGHELAATPGYAGDALTQYVVQIADPRWLVWDRGTPVTKSYNLRTDADGSYVTSTLNAGVAWTWQQILTDLWPSSVLGTAPTLPFTPDGTPECFWFQHAYPLNAVAFFLTRLCCGVKYDQVNDVYTIVRMGDTADASAAALTTLTSKYAGSLVYDGYPVAPYLASLPATIRVQFRVRAPYTDGTPPYYTIDQTVTPAAPTVNTAVLNLEDDLTALQTAGSVTNAAALTTRAAERATHWTAKRVNHDTALHREYDGLFDATAAIGCYVAAARWADFGAGVRTSLAAGTNADRRVEDWQRPLMTGETIPGVGIWGAPLIVGGLGSPVCCDGYLGSVCTCDPAGGSCSCSAAGGAKAAAIPATLTPDCCYILGGPGLGGGTGGGGITTTKPGCCRYDLFYFCSLLGTGYGWSYVYWVFDLCWSSAGITSVTLVSPQPGFGTTSAPPTQNWYASPHPGGPCDGQPGTGSFASILSAMIAALPASASAFMCGNQVGGGVPQVGGGGGGFVVPPAPPAPPQMHCQPGWHPWYDIITGQFLGCQPNTGANQNIIPITGQDALWRTPLGGEGLGGVGPDAAIDAGQITSATAGLMKVAAAGSAVSFITIPADATKVLLGDGTFGVSPGGGGALASGDQFGKTATTTLFTQAVGASDGTFRAGAYINVTSAGFGNHVALAVNYTDNNSSAQSISTGDIVVAQEAYIEDFQFRAKSGTNITIVATCTAGSPTFDFGGTLEKLR